MSLLLLAQLVAPPLQQGPLRLPETRPGQERPAPPRGQPKAPVDLEKDPGAEPTQEPTPIQEPPVTPPPGSQTLEPGGALPRTQGLSRYTNAQLQQILAECSRISDPAQKLKDCAAALTARLVADGYVSSRVYIEETAAGPVLEVVEGRLVDLRVNSPDERLNRRVLRLLKPLQNSVLHLPSIERNLRLLRRVPGVKAAKGNLGRLGSDPSQASLTITVKAGAPAWQGDFSIRNDGNNGSGEARAVATLVKPGALTSGDTLLLYGELNGDDQPELGSIITSISYTLPLSDAVNFTGAFGFSRRNLIELAPPANGLSTFQYQGLGQLEWVFKESLTERWSAFLGFSGNSSSTLLNGNKLPPPTPEIVRNPSTGFLRCGVSGSGIRDSSSWGGNLYMLSGISAVIPSDQKAEWQAVGIDPAQSTAIGGLLSGAWAFAPSWQFNARLGGQWAFNPLTPWMQFSLGSDVGIRGLPGQLISGDSGWLGVLETSWTFWQNKTNALQLVPFAGAGGVRTDLPGADFSDTVGTAGLLLRWLAGENWAMELGYAKSFETGDNRGVWLDEWTLGRGLYAKVQFRF